MSSQEGVSRYPCGGGAPGGQPGSPDSILPALTIRPLLGTMSVVVHGILVVVLVEALTLILRSEQPAERGELGKPLPVTSDSYVEGLGVQFS